MSLRLVLCLLLLCASLSVAARDTRQLGANGHGGTCPDQLSADADEIAPVRAGVKRDPAAAKEKPAMARGSEPQSVRPPRWHSFLPGMFR